MINSLSHISLSSRDLKKVKRFYVDLLKLKIVHEFKNKKGGLYGYFLYTNNSTFLEFFKSKKISNEKKVKLRHICFQTKNILQIKKKLFSFDKSIKIKRGKTDNIKQFFTKDFEGNIIEFHQYDKKSKFYNLIKKK